MPDLDRIRVVVEPDTAGFQSDLTTDLSKMEGSVDVSVDLDTTMAKVQVDKFKSGLKTDSTSVPVDADTRRAREALAKFTTAARAPISKLVNIDTTRATAALNGLQGAGAKAVGALGGLAKGGAIAGIAGLAVAASQGKDELLDMNRVSSSTSGILKNAGLSAIVSTKQIENLSGALLEKSGIDDQVIQSGENLLLSQKAFQDAIKVQPGLVKASADALVNLASTPFFKGNAEAAAKGFGKALADPEKGLNALRKAGILFTDAEKKRIIAMKEAGDTAGASAAIIDKVQKSTAGAAEARGKSVEGQLGKISEAFAGVGAKLLSTLLPTFTKVTAVIQKAFADNGFITRFVKALGPIIPIAKQIGAAFALVFQGTGEGVDIIGTLTAAMQNLQEWFAKNQTTVIAVVQIIKDFVVQVGLLIKALAPTLIPALKVVAVVLGLVVIGIIKVVTWILKIITYIAQFKLGIIALIAVFFGLPIAIIAAVVLIVTQIVKHFDAIKEYFVALPGNILAGLKAFGGMLGNVFRRAWNLVVVASKTIIGLYLAYLRAVPLRILNAVISVGVLLWNFYTGVWKKVYSITVTLVGIYINFIKGIPGKILSAIGAVGKLLYNTGKDVLEGLFDGLKFVWEKIKGWLGGLGKKIKNLKGPIEVDRTLLVDEGKAIMGGLEKGMKQKWSGVEGFLSSRGGFIKGMLSGIGLGHVNDAVGKLLTGELDVNQVNEVINKESSNGLHPSSGLADTMAQAQILHRILGIVATTFKAGHSQFVAGTNRVSQHFLGLAADFGDATAGNDHPSLDRAAEWMSKLVGKVFSQIIWRNAFWTGGRMGPAGAISGHTNHLHAGWIPRRHGGRVSAGTGYQVGEVGPEPFIPDQDGYVMSTANARSIMSMSSRVRNLETRADRRYTPEDSVQGVATGTGTTNNYDITLNHTVPNASSLLATLKTHLGGLQSASVPATAGGQL